MQFRSFCWWPATQRINAPYESLTTRNGRARFIRINEVSGDNNFISNHRLQNWRFNYLLGTENGRLWAMILWAVIALLYTTSQTNLRASIDRHETKFLLGHSYHKPIFWWLVVLILSINCVLINVHYPRRFIYSKWQAICGRIHFYFILQSTTAAATAESHFELSKPYLNAAAVKGGYGDCNNHSTTAAASQMNTTACRRSETPQNCKWIIKIIRFVFSNSLFIPLKPNLQLSKLIDSV